MTWTPRLRPATAEDLPRMLVVDERAFGISYAPEDAAAVGDLLEPDRFLLALDPGDGELVGKTGSFPFSLTLPGGGQLPVPGVTWVSVAVTHRRRGVLRALMLEQHRALAAAGAALSALTASEGGIYGRFGYGPATTWRALEVDRRLTGVRAGLGDDGLVRHADPAAARTVAEDVHERWRARTPGALSRDRRWWDHLLRDRPQDRSGGTALFHLVHPDGWAAYRVDGAVDGPGHRCRVVELFAATDAAHAALWRTLLSLDLVHTVVTDTAPLDDPLPFLLTDARQVRTTQVQDGMWVRLLDVPAALAARRYAVELDVVLDVADDFLDSGGRFRLRGGPDGAACERTDAAADAVTDVAALGSLYLGGHRASTLARAGALRVDDPRLLGRLDAALTAERQPRHGTRF